MSELLPAGAGAAGAILVHAAPLPGADAGSLTAAAGVEKTADPPLPEKLVEGYIDAINGGRISGWAWCRSLPSLAVEVEIRIADRLAAVARADLPRPDLAKAGLGDGRHGFSVLLDDPVAEDARASVSAFVRCSPDGNRAPLINRAVRPAAAVPPTPPSQPSPVPAPEVLGAALDEKLGRLSRSLEARLAAVADDAAEERAGLAAALRSLGGEIARAGTSEDLRMVREEVAAIAATAELLQLRLDAVQAAVTGDAAAQPGAPAREKALVAVVAALAVVSVSALALGLVATLF